MITPLICFRYILVCFVLTIWRWVITIHSTHFLTALSFFVCLYCSPACVLMFEFCRQQLASLTDSHMGTSTYEARSIRQQCFAVCWDELGLKPQSLRSLRGYRIVFCGTGEKTESTLS